jgi:flagellin-specific chaperone FliS
MRILSGTIEGGDKMDFNDVQKINEIIQLLREIKDILKDIRYNTEPRQTEGQREESR